ncbi:MAG: endolytic transglycosylase MltG [Xanthomonadales bacterium]|nr:endolytic transglycosylase MltG [Xanthomonadales bacterium]
MKKVLAALIVLAVAGVAAALLSWRQYQAFLEQPLAIAPPGSVLTVPAGASGGQIVALLDREGMTRAGWPWRLLMRLEPHVYRAGEYRLEAGMTPRQVLEKLASGNVVQYRFTAVEGWTFRQLAAALAQDDILVQTMDLEAATETERLIEELGIEHPEGWFLPETYQFTRGDSDRDLLDRMHTAMKDALAQSWESREANLPLETPYELLVLASIIEKETAIADERSQIAGVFIRRLRKGMRLQTDPTVIYGMGEAFDGDIRSRDLKTDTPYNTYTRHGLPPTPIALPGRAALSAAAQPAAGDALYFVADGEGGHTFSATLEEHQAAVRKLLGKN